MVVKVLGAVLAGGQSSRFGSDKALALLDGKSLIEHAIAAMAAQADAVIVCGREGEDWVPDRPEPGLGPLGGICAALHAAAARDYAAVLIVPCDVPALPAGLVQLLGPGPAHLTEMPVIGLWPASLAPQLDQWLAQSQDRSVRGWGKAVGAISVPIGYDIPNLNTPEDLRRLSGR
jgi:molybdopterin-guanine dinucleotide biosynthesis protein A